MPKTMLMRLASLATVLAFLAAGAKAAIYSGRVVDASSKKPIASALVTMDDKVVKTDLNGLFQIDGARGTIGVRAYGYLRQQIEGPQENGTFQIALTPFTPKALYLSFFGVGSTVLRESALKLTETTELNALVMDVKGDRGMIPYKSSIPLAAEVGAQSIITVKDMPGLLAALRERGIYTIARIVTFKDNPLAMARPELAVKTRTGAIWRDREGLAWTDPFQKEARDYNIDVAVEAAKMGWYSRGPVRRRIAWAPSPNFLPRQEKS